MYQWTRKDVANVKLALIIGLPFLALLSLRAFGSEGSVLLRILVGAAWLAGAALALRWAHFRRLYANAGDEAAEVDR
jgi:hypothetical protein